MCAVGFSSVGFVCLRAKGRMETPPVDPSVPSGEHLPAPESSVESISGEVRDVDSVVDAGNEVEAPSQTGANAANSIEQAGSGPPEQIDPGGSSNQSI